MLAHALTLLLISAGGCSLVRAQDSRIAQPEEIIIGRHSFFDFGPPMNFYEVYVLRVEGETTHVDRLLLTPPAGQCNEQTTFEWQTAVIRVPLTALLLDKDPCSITDKQITHEAHRKRDHLQFSGADLVMRISCSGRKRLLPIQLLEEDLFSDRPKPPTQTSWGMRVMGRLDSALGSNVADRPIFPLVSEPSITDVSGSETVSNLAAGQYDDLFASPSHVLSRLYAETLQTRQVSTIRLLSSSIAPITSPSPNYPPIGRAAHVEGTLQMHATILLSGRLIDITRVSGPELLVLNTTNTLKALWSFDKVNAGKPVDIVLGFDLNCNTSRRDPDLPR